MVDARLQTPAKNPNEKIFDATVRHLVGLERLQNGIHKQAVEDLDKFDNDILKLFSFWAASAFDESLSVAGIERVMREFEKELKPVNEEAYAAYAAIALEELRELAIYEAEFQKRLVERASGDVSGLVLGVGAALAATIVNNHPVRGHTSKQWVDGMKDARLAAIIGSLRESMLDGDSMAAAVQKVKGTRSAKFKDGLLERYRNKSKAFVRTAVTSIATISRDEFAMKNAELFRGVQWVSVLDSRTSSICIHRDGKIYPIGKGARPPAHINCRSTTSLILKGESPASDITYDQWLAKQKPSVVEEVLGVNRAKLYKEGNLPLKKMIGRDEKFINLADLKAVESKAFDKAGLGG